jgi:hypothetical protein
MTTTIITTEMTTITPKWILQIIEDDKDKKELAAMIAEVEAELANKTRAIIPKKPFKY